MREQVLLTSHSPTINFFTRPGRKTLERHKAGTCRVIPILLHPTYWEEAPFSSLQLLPTDARPITLWPNLDEEFQNVATEINRTIKDLLLSLKTKEEWFEEGNALYGLKRYEEAIAAFDQAIRLNPSNADYYFFKSLDLYFLSMLVGLNKRYEEAIATLDQAIRLNPGNADYYSVKGYILDSYERNDEATATYEQAIRLNPGNADTYYARHGFSLLSRKRNEEAKQATEKARQLRYGNS